MFRNRPTELNVSSGKKDRAKRARRQDVAGKAFAVVRRPDMGPWQ